MELAPNINQCERGKLNKDDRVLKQSLSEDQLNFYFQFSGFSSAGEIAALERLLFQHKKIQLNPC